MDCLASYCAPPQRVTGWSEEIAAIDGGAGGRAIGPKNTLDQHEFSSYNGNGDDDELGEAKKASALQGFVLIDHIQRANKIIVCWN